MGVFSRLRGSASRKASSSSDAPLPPIIGGSVQSYFSTLEIEKNTTVIACENIIANVISIFPFNVMYTDPKTKVKREAGELPLYAILKYRPNSSESPTQFKQKFIRHVLGKGNAYIFQAKDAAGNLVALRVLNPEYVRESYEGWQVKYNYTRESLDDTQILHIPALVTDDYGHGRGPVDLARAAVTLGNQFDAAALAAFGNGLNTKILVDISEALKDIADPNDQQKKVREYADYLAATYTGPQNAGKPFFPLNGMKVSELKGGNSNREAELLESRKWQDNVICSIFSLPDWLVKGTYDVKQGLGLEAAMIMVLNFALMPWIRHFEEKFETLLDPYQRKVYSVECDFSALLRVDQKARGDFWKTLFGIGAISPDEIAVAEGYPASKDGAGLTRFVPAQNMPVNQETFDAYMAKAKAIAAGILDPKTPADPAPPINSAVGE